MVGLLRGCLVSVLSPLFALLFGIAIGREHGFWLGCLAGLGILCLSGMIAAKLVNEGGSLTVADCAIPTILSIVSGIVFAPVQLFSGSLFSSASCIFAGLLLSVGMWLHKQGRMPAHNLILPALTFVYEMLPIELPTDLDNFIALGASTASFWKGYIAKAAFAEGHKRLIGVPADQNVIEVPPTTTQADETQWRRS